MVKESKMSATCGRYWWGRMGDTSGTGPTVNEFGGGGKIKTFLDLGQSGVKNYVGKDKLPCPPKHLGPARRIMRGPKGNPNIRGVIL